ncbi:MAG: Minor allergen Alt a 7 [Stictis urceolatum]|nr:Minor allergen Alt a 7 [Stictis urceolata]
MYGHIKQLAEAEAKGIEAAGGKVDLFQVEETLPAEVLTKMHAPGQDISKHPLISPDELTKYDAFLLGIPTRYGNFPAQWKTFWDRAGKVWQTGGLQGKYAGLFVSSASMGGGQESTALAAMSTLAHLGIVYVPLGYKHAFGLLAGLEEVRGGSAWGAGTFAGGDGSRMPTAKELEVAEIQGREFFKAGRVEGVKKEGRGRSANGAGAGGSGVAADGEAVEQKEVEEGPCGLPPKCVIL